jgi:uncharacterized membrane protein YqiK
MNAHATVAEIGHNNPPLSPYETVTLHLDGLLLETRNWADGSGVENQSQADEVSRLIEDLRQGEKAADEARVQEKAPLDRQIEEIQDRYNLYIAPLKNKKPGKVPVAIEALKATLKPFLDKLAAEKAAEAERLRKEAEAKAQAAAEAARAASVDNLEAREAAEDLADAAEEAARIASRAENDKAQAKGGSRALGLRTVYRAEITDPKAALIHYVGAQREAVLACLLSLAQTDVNQGKRQIPGVTVHTETRL